DNLLADTIVLGQQEQPAAGYYRLDTPGSDVIEQAMLADTATYLPDDLLVKVDRASMAVSLEVRIPLLDPAVFEFAWRLDPADRIRDGGGKWPLRQLLKRSLPEHLVDRPKMGFGVPVGQWLREPLRSWGDELLDPVAFRQQGYLDPVAVRQL
ncbi:asparagine synthase C-terminal domain-containing protein, partial [Arthrospira platensis SPKY2]